MATQPRQPPGSRKGGQFARLSAPTQIEAPLNAPGDTANSEPVASDEIQGAYGDLPVSFEQIDGRWHPIEEFHQTPLGFGLRMASSSDQELTYRQGITSMLLAKTTAEMLNQGAICSEDVPALLAVYEANERPQGVTTDKGLSTPALECLYVLSLNRIADERNRFRQGRPLVYLDPWATDLDPHQVLASTLSECRSNLNINMLCDELITRADTTSPEVIAEQTGVGTRVGGHLGTIAALYNKRSEHHHRYNYHRNEDEDHLHYKSAALIILSQAHHISPADPTFERWLTTAIPRDPQMVPVGVTGLLQLVEADDSPDKALAVQALASIQSICDKQHSGIAFRRSLRRYTTARRHSAGPTARLERIQRKHKMQKAFDAEPELRAAYDLGLSETD